MGRCSHCRENGTDDLPISKRSNCDERDRLHGIKNESGDDEFSASKIQDETVRILDAFNPEKWVRKLISHYFCKLTNKSARRHACC